MLGSTRPMILPGNYTFGMLNDIKQLIEKCQACRIHKPSLPKNPRSALPPSSYMGPPMAHVGTNLFDFGGGKYLV